MKIRFKNTEEEKIKKCFLTVMKRYKALHDYEIILNQKPIKASTMQAQPLISLNRIFTGVKKYQITLSHYVSDSKELGVAQIPDDVLTGWFAHELGHLVDYVPYANFQMIRYGIKYLLFNKFKIQAEHSADYIAINKGFKDEILATKRWILNHDLIHQSYKDKMHSYYLSIDHVELCNPNEPLLQPIIAQ